MIIRTIYHQAAVDLILIKVIPYPVVISIVGDLGQIGNSFSKRDDYLGEHFVILYKGDDRIIGGKWVGGDGTVLCFFFFIFLPCLFYRLFGCCLSDSFRFCGIVFVFFEFFVFLEIFVRLKFLVVCVVFFLIDFVYRNSVSDIIRDPISIGVKSIQLSIPLPGKLFGKLFFIKFIVIKLFLIRAFIEIRGKCSLGSSFGFSLGSAFGSRLSFSLGSDFGRNLRSSFGSYFRSSLRSSFGSDL